MVVAYIFRQQPSQVTFIHCNSVVQQVTAATLDPAFCYAVLPRTFERGSHRVDPQRPDGVWHVRSVLAIPVEAQEPRDRFKRERFPELLNDPQACRMLRNIEVQDPPTIMTDDEETI